MTTKEALALKVNAFFILKFRAFYSHFLNPFFEPKKLELFKLLFVLNF